MNGAYMRAIHTGASQQIVVMTLPPHGWVPPQLRPDTDQLIVVAEGVGEVRVGPLALGVEAGDLVFVKAGTVHALTNRAATPLRMIAVFSPPLVPPGAVFEPMDHAPAAPAPPVEDPTDMPASFVPQPPDAP